MTATSCLLARGDGWRVEDVVCTAGPQDRPFEEQHNAVCIAAVTDGTFQYRTARGAAVLAPGALMLGNDRECFECGHEHGAGDRCLSFHFTQALMEEVVGATPRARHVAFAAPRLPPLPTLIPVLAAAEAARDGNDPAVFEELALTLASRVTAVLTEAKQSAYTPTRHDERRITAVLRRIETAAEEPHSLAALAREVAMSRYHFLRTFHAVVGMTPHQFTLHTRMRRAAARLRRSGDGIAAIAFEAGFNDLSTFNRRFRRVVGQSPRAWRAGARPAA